MKVIKVDIKTETLDIDSNQNVFQFLHEPINLNKVVSESVLNAKIEPLEYNIKNYQIRKVYHNNKLKKTYLVEINKDEIFNDLLLISDEEIHTIKQKALKEALYDRRIVTREYFSDRLKMERDNIKAKSWWERLFNKF